MSSNDAQYKMGDLFSASLIHASQCQGLPSPFFNQGVLIYTATDSDLPGFCFNPSTHPASEGSCCCLAPELTYLGVLCKQVTGVGT